MTSTDKQNILVTGAAGTVGRNAIQHLLSSGKDNITAFALYSPQAVRVLEPFKNRIKIVYGDITNKVQVENACKNQDVVIHLAAIIPPLADDKPVLASKVNVEGTRNVIESLKRVSPEAFLVYTSSVACYGDRLANPDIFTTDKQRASLGDYYAETKIVAEQSVRESGLRWTVMRVAAVMGGNNHKMSKLMFHMPLDTHIEFITPSDAGRAVALSVDHQDELNQNIYNLGGGKACRWTYRELMNRTFEVVGLGKADFPEKSFAEKNFHCGFYADGDILENILHFRKENIDDYLNQVLQANPKWRRIFVRMFQRRIKNYLLRQSEPLRAHKKGNQELIERFFVNV